MLKALVIRASDEALVDELVAELVLEASAPEERSYQLALAC